VEKVFLAAGFPFARQEGSHRSYLRSGTSRAVAIPTDDEVPVSIIKEQPENSASRGSGRGGPSSIAQDFVEECPFPCRGEEERHRFVERGASLLGGCCRN
jgi:predicted RNA binding protein YcfA (HicA-like mRNA interferase family)